jgi:hypothetical protein
MAYISRQQLLDLARNTERIRIAKATLATKTSAQASVFLSHSHQDRNLIEAGANLLANQGISVYVDWLDGNMPAVTSPVTASRLKEKINENGRFLLLATDKSLASRWVPWELGYADGVKPADIAIMPVLERLSDPPTEYIGLYPRVEVSAFNGRGLVYRPGETTPFRTLESWLRG